MTRTTKRGPTREDRFRLDVLSALAEYGVLLRSISNKLTRLSTRIGILETEGSISMATLDDLVSKVQEEGSVVDSVVTLVQGLRDQLAAAQGDPAKIDAVLAEMDRQSQRLGQAVSNSDDVETPVPVDPAPAPDQPSAGGRK